jgi:L-fucose isomerase-like protein
LGKIAFIRVAHKDYQSEISRQKGKEALDSLNERKIEFFSNGKPLDDAINAREFGYRINSENVDGVIIFFDTWTEPAVVMSLVQEVKHLPIAIWGFPMFPYNGLMESTGSFVALPVFSGALKRLQIKHIFILGLPTDKDALDKVVEFVKVASTIKSLRAIRIGLVGYAAMSIYSGTFDHLKLRGVIGPEVIQIDSYTLLDIAQCADKNQYGEFLKSVTKYATISKDLKSEYLEKEGRLYYAIKELIKIYKLDSINVKCQYELSQAYKCIACPALSLIAEEGPVTACEGDVLTTVSQIILNLLTGQPIAYGDILNVEKGEAIFSACGFAPYSLAENPEKVQLNDINHPGFEGPVVSLAFKKGKITYMRINEGADGYIVNIGTGVGLNSELRQGRFPALKFKIDGEEKKFLETLYCQHYAICYGDYVKEIVALCNFLNIDYMII